MKTWEKYRTESISDSWHPYILILEDGWKSQVGNRLPVMLASVPWGLSPLLLLAMVLWHIFVSFIFLMILMLPCGVIQQICFMLCFLLVFISFHVIPYTFMYFLLVHYVSSVSLWWLMIILFVVLFFASIWCQKSPSFTDGCTNDRKVGRASAFKNYYGLYCTSGVLLPCVPYRSLWCSFHALWC